MLFLAPLLVACHAVITPPPLIATPTPLAASSAHTTPTTAAFFMTPLPPTPTFTPSPTPTPVIYTVVQGDTPLGIALEYGISLDALYKANALTADDYLQIGQALVIPLDEDAPDAIGLVAPISKLLLPTPTPLPLETRGVALYRTPVGGYWCMGEVRNTTAAPITNIQVEALLVAADGSPLAAQTSLAAADYLAPQARAPFAVLFQTPPGGVSDVRVSLLRGETVGDITAGFVALEVLGAEGGVSGPQYRVSGRVRYTEAGAVQAISVVVTVYDAAGVVLGYRHTVLRPDTPLASGQEEPFKILLTPYGMEAPVDFQVLAWGNRVE